MWNSSEVPLQLPGSRSSDRLLQPLWNYLIFHHYSLVSSPFFPVLLAFSSYFIFSLPFAIVDLLGERASVFYRYKIQKERRPTLRMMAKSLGMAVYNHLVFVVPAVVINNVVMPAPPLPTVAPTLWELVSGGLGALLIFDTQYFLWHMVHHKNPHLYKWVHAIHHDYISPFSWSTQHLSAVELMTVGFWSNLDPILLQCHPLTTWTLTVFSIWLSVEDHIGYDLPWTPSHLVPFGLLGGAMAHDMHHQKPSSNFAPFFSHWDKLFGTASTYVKPTETVSSSLKEA
ncbi:cholesterol 25-hydroxylase-like protein 1, member 1 [Chanos chanos]|uniref:Cholesterol 25-hydroxylase-like protein 1, member 1 n=1 Tax=Chanos chanos TaxID=29144 RepID=A0A6J2ULM1_CHACN|nr:cholesterol 25-hydroxylase-like protein 1, member 1 [Chanos chanos]